MPMRSLEKPSKAVHSISRRTNEQVASGDLAVGSLGPLAHNGQRNRGPDPWGDLVQYLQGEEALAGQACALCRGWSPFEPVQKAIS